MKYLQKAKSTAYIGLQTSMIYKKNFLFGFLSGIMTLIVQLVFWPSFYSAGTDYSFATIKNTVIAGYSLNEIMTYSLVIYFIQRGNSMMNIGTAIKQDIKSGGLNILLVRPTNYLWSKWVFSFSGQFMNMILSFLVFIMILTCIRIGFVLPMNGQQTAFVILFILFAYVLSFLINSIIGLLSFWILETSSISMIVNATITILSGAIFPLNYLNSNISVIIKYLPFSYLAWFPAQVYLNKVDKLQIEQNLLICVFWIIVLLIAVYRLWKNGVRRYAAYGG